MEDPRGFRDKARMSYEDFQITLQNYEEFLLGRAFLTANLVGKIVEMHMRELSNV